MLFNLTSSTTAAVNKSTLDGAEVRIMMTVCHAGERFQLPNQTCKNKALTNACQRNCGVDTTATMPILSVFGIRHSRAMADLDSENRSRKRQ